MTLPQAFHQLTARVPFPWQERLLQKWSKGNFTDEVLQLETGTGKTSTIAIWLAALAANPDLVPRRLIYVVNRRTVVDQTTSEVEQIRERLRDTQLDTQLKKLSVLSLDSEEISLAVSTLRGQLADNRVWSADPARPAVIIGTVDMIGSRMLFSGYGIGWKTRPLHAGFLGQDSLIIHDECHLEPAFQTLLESIRRFQAKSFRPARLIALSATPREGLRESFTLQDEDFQNEVLKNRLTASKALSLHQVEDPKKLPEAIAGKAFEYLNSNKPVLVFTDTLKAAIDVQGALKKALGKKKDSVRTLTGTMRGHERDELVSDPIFTRFLPSSKSDHSGAAYLIATSAGEVGVNLSSAHLICDLVPFERMAQRLGRLNRFGEYQHATADVFHSNDQDDHSKKTIELLSLLNGDASPKNLSSLDSMQKDEASSSTPEIVPATDILLDALAFTSIRELPTRPESLDPYLHGKPEKELPRTTIAWREEVSALQGIILESHPPQGLLDSFRLKPHETLSDRTDRILAELKKLAKTQPNLPVWLADTKNKVTPSQLDQIADKEMIANKTVILPPEAGGLSDSGMLDAKAPAPDATSLDVSCHFNDRLRRRDAGWPGDEWRLVQRLELESDDSEDPHVWSWYEKAWEGDGKGQQTSETVLLSDHNELVAQFAAQMAKSLGFPQDICQAIEIAARWHDQGKSRETWQRAAGNRKDVPVAKPLASAFFNPGFRHELSSLMDIQSDAEFLRLSEEQREIVLHLIAAHHGRARPIFPKKEVKDPELPTSLVGKQAAKTPTRFSKLQRQFGHWGLAYLESIIRAADYAASAGRKPNPQNFND